MAASLWGRGGSDIWGTSDQFRFAYKQLSGDGSIVIRVDGVDNSDGWAKAGLMIRQNTNANAINAGIFVTPANGVSFQYRTTAGSDSANVAQARLGGSILGEAESDGRCLHSPVLSRRSDLD